MEDGPDGIMFTRKINWDISLNISLPQTREGGKFTVMYRAINFTLIGKGRQPSNFKFRIIMSMQNEQNFKKCFENIT